MKKEVERYEESPFVEAIEIHTRGRLMTVAVGSPVIDRYTGEVIDQTVIAQRKEVDDEQFVKIFTKDLVDWFKLSKTGQRVFGALLTVVQDAKYKNQDMIFFDHTHKAVKTFSIGRSTFYVGIEELCAKKFIARHISNSWLFINPAMFFNGDRAIFIKEYRKKKRNELLDTRQKNLFPEPAINEEPEGSA